jgi:hypothetical protein
LVALLIHRKRYFIAAALTTRPAQSNDPVMVPRLIFAVFLAAAALPALADDVPLPELTPKGQYLVMTQDDATSTSKCIGDPKTPMCAVETLMACYQRGDENLCRVSGLEPQPALGGITIYRVVRREVLTDRHFPWTPVRDPKGRPGEIRMRAGDIRIDIITKHCRNDVSQRVCDVHWTFPEAYIVRQQDDRWKVTDGRPAYDLRMRLSNHRND